MDEKVTFADLIVSLANSALIYMGGVEDPESKKPILDLKAARRMIDTIDMLREKTKGNLTDDEERLLEGVLYSLKMTYVKVSMKSESKGGEDEDRGDS